MTLAPTSIQAAAVGPLRRLTGIGERGARPSLSRPDANEHAFLESRRLHVADRVARNLACLKSAFPKREWEIGNG